MSGPAPITALPLQRNTYGYSSRPIVDFMAIGDALLIKNEVGCGRKADLQDDRPKPPLGKNQLLFRNVRNNGVEPIKANSGMRFGVNGTLVSSEEFRDTQRQWIKYRNATENFYRAVMGGDPKAIRSLLTSKRNEDLVLLKEYITDWRE